MNKLYLVTIAFLLPCLFCQQPNKPEPSPETTQPGYFSLTLLEGLHKTGAGITPASNTNTIDLGDLHSTTSYYFLLTNTGGKSITNIQLSVSDSSFQIFPTSIDSLTVGLGTQSLVPIIKLTALHGTGAQGLGTEPLMSPGIHQVNINVSGTTKLNNTDTTVSLVATVKINALVMDVNVHTTLTAIGLSDTGTTLGGYTYDGFIASNIPMYEDSTDTIITIVNTGNVNLKIKSEGLNMSYDSSSCIINVGDSANFIFQPGYGQIIRFDGNNTVSDPTKLPLQSDGKSYLIIENTY
jgi:hypothetical protein